MASFCAQCSVEVGSSEEYSDFGGVELAYVLCEGCGWTWVNFKGRCIGDCVLKHGGRQIFNQDIPIRDRLRDENELESRIKGRI